MLEQPDSAGNARTFHTVKEKGRWERHRRSRAAVTWSVTNFSGVGFERVLGRQSPLETDCPKDETSAATLAQLHCWQSSVEAS